VLYELGYSLDNLSLMALSIVAQKCLLAMNFWR
jgi:hypothetical protein